MATAGLVLSTNVLATSLYFRRISTLLNFFLFLFLDLFFGHPALHVNLLLQRDAAASIIINSSPLPQSQVVLQKLRLCMPCYKARNNALSSLTFVLFKHLSGKKIAF